MVQLDWTSTHHQSNHSSMLLCTSSMVIIIIIIMVVVVVEVVVVVDGAIGLDVNTSPIKSFVDAAMHIKHGNHHHHHHGSSSSRSSSSSGWCNWIGRQHITNQIIRRCCYAHQAW